MKPPRPLPLALLISFAVLALCLLASCGLEPAPGHLRGGVWQTIGPGAPVNQIPTGGGFGYINPAW